MIFNIVVLAAAVAGIASAPELVSLLALIWLFGLSVLSARFGRHNSDGEFRRYDYFFWGPWVFGIIPAVLWWVYLDADSPRLAAGWLAVLVIVTSDHMSYLRGKITDNWHHLNGQ